MAKQSRAGLQIKKVYLTAEGLEELKKELKDLKEVKRIEIAERIRQAREMGDPAENSGYEAALDEQALIENRVAELEEDLRTAKVITPSSTSTDIVTIGSSVIVEMDGQMDEFEIVGRVEANPAKKRISNESPLGAALLGAKVGEEVNVTTPIIKYKCKVVEIK